MKKRILAMLLAVVMLLCLAACGAQGSAESTITNDSAPVTESQAEDADGEESIQQSEKVLTAGVTTAWTTLNATGGSGDIDIFIRSLMYDTLVNIDMDGVIHPRLASSWEVDDSGLVWTIHINEDANWSDGEPVTAADVAYTYNLYATEGFCNFSTYCAYIEGTEQSGIMSSEGSLMAIPVDEKTLEITTKFSMEDSLLMSSLQNIYIVPEHIYGEMDPFTIADSEIWYTEPVTSGAMCFLAQIDGQSIEFTANKDYFLGSPNIDRFVVKVVASSAVAAALMSGDIDFTAGPAFSAVSLNDYELLEDDDNIVIEPIYGYNYRYLCINQQIEYFSDVRVRQALSMAINRDEIVESLLRGFGSAIYTPYGDNHPYYNDGMDLSGYVPYDPDAARALLEEAGWDFDQEITITAASNSEVRQQMCMMVQQYWQNIGIKVTVETVDFATMFSGLSSGDIEIGIMGQVGNATATEPIDAYTPGHAIDMSHLSSDYFYQTYLAMKSTGDMDEIAQLCDELQQAIVDEVPYIYLVSEATLQAYRSNVLNYDMSDANCRYWPIWEWDVQQNISNQLINRVRLASPVL